jgi:hypothetical protein
VSIDFAKIAPYLKDPLVLIGFFLFLAFLFCRYLIKHGIIPTLPPKLGFRILRTILLYGFILGLLLIGLGFALKYRELQETKRADEARLDEQRQKDENERADRLKAEVAAHEKDIREQQAAVARLKTELEANLAVADQLRRNTIVFLNNFNTLTEVTRTPGIKLLDVMFPKENLDLKEDDATAAGLADRAIDRIRDSGFLSDELEREKLTASAQAISRTIEATLFTAESLQDPNERRYRFYNTVWQNDQLILAKVIVADITPYQESYSRLALLRANYDVVGAHFVEYLKALHDFFDPAKHLITRDSLRNVLTKERYCNSLLVRYGDQLASEMARIKALQAKVQHYSETQTASAARTP